MTWVCWRSPREDDGGVAARPSPQEGGRWGRPAKQCQSPRRCQESCLFLLHPPTPLSLEGMQGTGTRTQVHLAFCSKSRPVGPGRPCPPAALPLAPTKQALGLERRHRLILRPMSPYPHALAVVHFSALQIRSSENVRSLPCPEGRSPPSSPAVKAGCSRSPHPPTPRTTQ